MTDHNSQFMAILTAVGEAKQANANALGIPWVISEMAVGDANGTDPMPDRHQTALLNEQHRAGLSQLKLDDTNDAMIIAELVIPEQVGGWWIREIGLYDEDGDLVVIANCPPTYKPQLAQGSGRTQVIRLNIIVSSAQNIELKIDPSMVLATREYVDLLVVRASQAEAEAGTNAVKLMTPLRTAQAIAAQGLKLGTSADTAAAGNDSRLSDAREWTAELVAQAEAEAGTATTARKWSAQRVAQAIAALSLKLGTTAGTAAAGNDSRLSDAREWTAEVVTKTEAEVGTATTARKWTAQRVAQAIAALSLKLGTTAGTAAAGNDSRITGAVQTAGTGLTKTGTTLAVKYGTTAGTAVEGNDPRLAGGGDWDASIVSQAEAEAGTATTARKWTAQRVAQAIAALSLKLGTTAGTAAAGNDSRITGAVQTAGTGLTKTGTTLAVKYGTTAGTAVEGNDSRLAEAGNWNASIVSQAEAEAGTATTARKWTAQRVAQAIAALGLKLGTTAGTAAAGNDSRITGAVQTAGTGLTKNGTTLAVKYGTTAGTAVQGNELEYLVSGARLGIETYTLGGRVGVQLSTEYRPLGVSQTWQSFNQTTRKNNTNYTNTTGRPIAVSINPEAAPKGGTNLYSEAAILVNNLIVAHTMIFDEIQTNLFAIVPAGATYKLEITGTALRYYSWFELR